MKQKYGFTLIELLIVIAIIAILAAILFPVFAKVREKARQTACLSNEKQLGLALLQYNQDYDETFPCTKTFPWTPGGPPQGIGWAGQIYPYVKSRAAYTCPDNSSAKSDFVISYGLNWQMFPNVTLTQLNSPSKTVYLFELDAQDTTNEPDPTAENKSGVGNGFSDNLTAAGAVYAIGNLTNPGTPASAQVPTVANTNLLGRHNEGANYLMADGHAKWLKPGMVSPGYETQSWAGPLADDPSWCNTTWAWNYAAHTGCDKVQATFSLF